MRNWKFQRLFQENPWPNGRPSAIDIDAFVGALNEFTYEKDSAIPAAYTYFAQLIDHDLSRTRNSSSGFSGLQQARRPALDLDTIYGGGLDDSTVPYDRQTGKFILGPVHPDVSFQAPGARPQVNYGDFPRNSSGKALIADSRNDENLLIGQMQVLWMNLHNKLVDHYVTAGVQSADNLFKLAHEEVLNVYQCLVLRDFCPRILPMRICGCIILRQTDLLGGEERDPLMPIEFASAAFRLHSMVRSSYKINTYKPKLTLAELIARTGHRTPGSTHPLLYSTCVDWRLFLDYPYEPEFLTARNKALAPSLNTKVFDKLALDDFMPPSQYGSLNVGSNLDIRKLSIARGVDLDLPSGQQVQKELISRHPALAKDLDIQSFMFPDSLNIPDIFRGNTPLWAYLMHEASIFQNSKLGHMGGWIVGSTLVKAAKAAFNSCNTGWEPKKSPLYVALRKVGKPDDSMRPLELSDVVKFVYH